MKQLYNFAAEEAEGIAQLGIDPKALLLQAATFVILFVLFRKFALEKVVKTLEQRRQKIDEGIANAEDYEKKLVELEDEKAQQMQSARKEADSIVANAHEESGRIVQEAEASANNRADKIVKDAKKTVDAEVVKAKKALKADMIDLVAAATETLVDEKVDAKKDAKLIEKALAGVENE